ncbi:MAG: HD-GYP domain-containing protein [Chloroflexia bacterium]
MTYSENYLLALLDHIGALIAGRAPLAEIFCAIAEAAGQCGDTRGSLLTYFPPSQPPEYYGSTELLPLGPVLLPRLEALSPAAEETHPSGPPIFRFEFPLPGSGATTALTTLVYAGQILGLRPGLRAALTVFCDRAPAPEALQTLRLLHHHLRIAIENRLLGQIVSESYTSTIRALASAIDARDPTTHRHSQAVTELAVALAEALGLSEEEVNTIRYAAILHDIGKIGIGEAILFKPGPLTPQERAIVEAHPLVGASILAGIPYLEPLIPLILHHHERYDGSGYPDGLRYGDPRFPLGAQILAIADAFDAMTTERPYHRGLSIDEACSFLLQQAGKAFHPELVRIFVRMIRTLRPQNPTGAPDPDPGRLSR